MQFARVKRKRGSVGPVGSDTRVAILCHSGFEQEVHIAEKLKTALEEQDGPTLVRVELLEVADRAWYYHCTRACVCLALLSPSFFQSGDCENQLTFAKDTGQGIVPILVDSGFPQAMQSPAIPIQASEAMELPEKVLATRLEECHQENARLRQELIAKEKELSTADTQHEASGVAPGDARERDNAGRKLPLKCCDQQASKCCSIS